MPAVHRHRDVCDGHGCLEEGTVVACLNGKNVPIEKLVGREFWVYAIDRQNKIVPAKAFDCVYKGERGLVELVLDNGKVVRGTGDHKIALKNGSYRELEKLKSGDRLRAFYRRVIRTREWETEEMGYEQVYQDGWVWTHRLVYEWKVGLENRQAHHGDHNSRNNEPGNLIGMEKKRHFELHHRMKRGVAFGFLKKRNIERNPMSLLGVAQRMVGVRKLTGSYEGAGKHLQTLEALKLASERMLKSNPMVVFNKEIRDKRARNWGFGSDEELREKVVGLYVNGSLMSEISKELGVSKAVVRERLKGVILDRKERDARSRGFESNEQAEEIINASYQKRLSGPVVARELGVSNSFVYSRIRNNHRVVEVRKIGVGRVYDFSVEGTHNYALDVGVFVHNCFPSRPNAQASTNVFCNDLGIHRVGDAWQVHCCVVCHGGNLAAGSPTVYVNDLACGRIGDPVSCGSSCAQGSPDVFADD